MRITESGPPPWRPGVRSSGRPGPGSADHEGHVPAHHRGSPITGPQTAKLEALDQPTAILVAAVIAVAGYMVNHTLRRWAERKRAEERAVAGLAGAAMVFQQLGQFRESFGTGPAWRQLLLGKGRSMPDGLACRIAERGLDSLDEVVRAHGALLQHARARLADAASDVLDACIRVGENWDNPNVNDVRAADRELGRARIRLFEVSRGRRSARWRLGRPAVFDNIEGRGS